MRYTRVCLDALGYEIAPNVVSSAWIEERLAPMYQALHLQPGQLEALTGIRERHWWDPGFANADGAARAGRKALAQASVGVDDIGVLLYAGVCRDNFEPATACAVAAQLGLGADAEIYDVSNACLGVLNGIINIANRIELSQIRAGMIVSCETAREITNVMIDRMLESPTMETFKTSLATLTGGSGAVAMVLTGDVAGDRPQLRGGVVRAAPEHHAICRWGADRHVPPRADQIMETDPVAVLKHGTALGVQTWEAFLREMSWTRDDVDRVICHQVGSVHQEMILRAFGVPPEKDFSTFEYLGNMGTVSLPLTAALARERGFLQRGHRVGFLGIGSGLNCLMLGWQW